jgi:hypothetical protein
MKLIKIIAFLAILPYLASFAGCQFSDKQTGGDEKQRMIQVTDLEAPPTSMDESKPFSMGVTSQTQSDGNLKQDVLSVNYQQQTENFNTQDKRMIVRSGTMNIEAESFSDTEAKIKQIVNSSGGYITNSSSLLNASGKKQGAITIRVESNRFDQLLDELAKVGKVVNQNISGKDVTEEYMDAEARAKTQRELESRLLKLLAEKTANLTSVVEVEQKLAGVRENIEKTEGRMRYLKDQASYSTLTVSVFEPSMLTTSTGGGFFYELGESINRGLSGFTRVLSGIITFIIAFSPILAIILIAVYFVKRYLKKRKLAQTA